MSETEPVVHVRMLRPDMADLPRHDVPAPYSLRCYRDGDEVEWTRIWRAAQQFGAVGDDLFRQEFGRDEEMLAANMFLLCDGDGVAIGTTTAWTNEHYPGFDYGRVHWIAIVPPMHGRGLAKPLLSACMDRMVKEGRRGAYLHTQSPRIPAISLYLRFGFVPVPRSDEEEAAWRRVREKVAPELRATLDRGL